MIDSSKYPLYSPEAYERFRQLPKEKQDQLLANAARVMAECDAKLWSMDWLKKA